MKYFLDHSTHRMRLAVIAICLAGFVVAAYAELPSWIRNVEASTALDAVFFRMMSLPKGAVAFRRPPRETRPALTDLIKSQPHSAELYSLRALEDEQELDATAAEADWKAYVENSSDKPTAQLALADFYHRRLRPADEIDTLSYVANTPPIPSERLISPAQQHSWQAFERIFSVIEAQGLPKEVSIVQYRAWIHRYPAEGSLYARFLEFLVAQKEYSAAARLIDDYRKQFPGDQIFPVRAEALVEYRRGSVREGLAIYERSFQPLWDPQLVKSYFDLLGDTHNLRKFRDDTHAVLLANSQDLNAAARLFYYYQQQGKMEAAEQVITDFRLHKEASKSSWTSQELFTCARLLEEIHAYPEAARYYFALYNSKDLPNAQETAIAALTGILLTAPETPIRLGSGDLSIYRDIGTIDRGPGYLNGILSLLLNTTDPGSQYSEEELKAQPYFRRSRAGELLALLDKRFPKAARRAELHSQLIEYYANSGESEAVLQAGREFLADFPNSAERTSVALLMADAYARTGDAQGEFAIYDDVLRELAAKSQNLPLGSAGSYSSTRYTRTGDTEGGEESQTENSGNVTDGLPESFQLTTAAAQGAQSGPRSPEYSRVLERYLSRLVQMKQIPSALGVLRREIDRNPDDPGLYERLAVFLDQNRLGLQQEEVYRLAISRFSDKTWYDKLARFYLRYKRDSEFEKLTRDAVSTFKGTELEHYFDDAVGGSPALYVRLNLYANQRFPHNPVFVRNLLSAYRSPITHDEAAWEALIRQHWFEDAGLRNQFFEYLSSRGLLESELVAIRASAPDTGSWERNPAAANFIAHANLWNSHFEQSAPVLKSLATQYPSDAEITQIASSVYRSLAYFDSTNTVIAAKIQDNFLKSNPTDTTSLARIGDIYADREQFAQASPYWERIPKVTPGQPDGYLQAATIYWDYFDFQNARRLLNDGRQRLSNPNLYAYEAGAIYENERDYPRAIDEYVKGAINSPGSSAELRLLQLAGRSKLRDLIEEQTAKLANPASTEMASIYLRVKVLEAQNRTSELESFLNSIANSTTSIEQAEKIETLAQQKSFETVRQHAIERQAALSTDPINRMQLRYTLIRLYEGRKDFSSAQKNVEAMYHDNPKILGVIRATVDFYWRMKMQSQAIAALLQASKDANRILSRQFAYEAARKSTEAKQFQQARDVLTSLLKDDPYNGEYLAAMAEIYAQAEDDRGLEQFYRDQIAAFRTAPVPADTRKTQIATLRRGLIPALTRMKNYSGAVDQYIELINKFPEDDALVTEAALYALHYGRQEQLVGFYVKTVAQSPRDYRWSMVLARTQTNLEDYPAAIDTYAKSIAIRPDRVDLYIARVELEERLMRFDEAAADYEHIYQLAYRDPQWMQKLAVVRARQGRIQEAVSALKAALIDGRPDNARNYLDVARRLEAWGMLEQARGFAEQGLSKAGTELLADPEYRESTKAYVRIMTRLRRYDEAYSTLQQSLQSATATLPILKEQVQKQGVTGLTDAQWRDHMRVSRMETARTGMQSALQEMGTAADTYFTPEERLTFARFAESKRSGMDIVDVATFAIPLAVNAALADQEAHWRLEVILDLAQQPNHSLPIQPFVDLQRKRGRFAELGTQMEQIPERASLTAAADAYESAGDAASELRVLTRLFVWNDLDTNRENRFFQLLLENQPQELIRIASLRNNSSADPAAAYILSHGRPALAHAAVQARSQDRPPVWNKAYTALVGLYFSERTPEINNTFIGLLGDEPIGARLPKPVDREQQLAGDVWFYYGSRYGDYLGSLKLGNSENFLPAVLEQSAASSSGYLTLADYYSAAGDTKRAIEEYNHTLELSPDRPDIFDNLAVNYFKQGDRTAATAQWKQAFAALLKQLNSSRVPESFWRDFGRTCDQLRTRHLFTELKPAADEIVRTYLHQNGIWRSNAVLHPAYFAQGDPATATTWLMDISSSAPDPAKLLGDVVDLSWIPKPQRALIYQRILELKENSLGKLDGRERQSAQQDLSFWQERWINYLVESNQYAQALNTLSTLPRETQESQKSSLVPLELRAAAQLGTLDSILNKYRNEPGDAPSAEILRNSARQLFEFGDKQSARKILELVFAREIEEHKLVAANFLGLAEIRLAAGDTRGALDLLHRLILAVGNPLENLDPAAVLLEKSHRNAEAIEFLEQLVKTSPWDDSYRLRLAKAKLASSTATAEAQTALQAIASNPSSSYELRLEAAASLEGKSHTAFGSGELDLIAADPQTITTTVADRFYYYEARMKAAQHTTDAKTRFQLLSHCVIDFPRRNTVRVPLFQAAIQTQSDEYALGILEPLFQTQFLRNNPAEAVNDEAKMASSDDEEEGGGEFSTLGSTAEQISTAQQAQVAHEIGDAMKRVGRFADALSYYESARTREKSAATRKILLRKIGDMKDFLRVERQNTARQPVLHEALEQDRIVRPRLIATVTHALRTRAPRGGKQ